MAAKALAAVSAGVSAHACTAVVATVCHACPMRARRRITASAVQTVGAFPSACTRTAVLAGSSRRACGTVLARRIVAAGVVLVNKEDEEEMSIKMVLFVYLCLHRTHRR